MVVAWLATPSRTDGVRQLRSPDIFGMRFVFYEIIRCVRINRQCHCQSDLVYDFHKVCFLV